MPVPPGDVGELAGGLVGGVEAGGLAVELSLGGVVGEAAGERSAGPAPVRSAGASVQAAAVMESRARKPIPRRALRIGDLPS